MGQLFRSRRGGDSPTSGAGAAILVLIIAALLVLYVAFLPADEKNALLEEQDIPGTPPSSSSGYSHLIGTSALEDRIGKISAINDEEIRHELTSFRLHTETEAAILSETPRVSVKNSAFDKSTHTMEFSIDPKSTSDVYLSYNVLFGDGQLKIHLNGVPIYDHEKDYGSIEPIKLPKHLLKHENVLHMSVSSPGIAFWSTNIYRLESIQLTADVQDKSDSLNEQLLYLSPEELEYFDKATLSFYPDCEAENVGPIDIAINGEKAFHGIPDCHMKNFIKIHKKLLQDGENNISFISNEGEYIIDQPMLEVELTDVEHPIYYFDLEEDLFRFKKDKSNYCGKIDGVCPDNCLPYEDKDCCFEESRKNYWCDVKTNNPRDRCANMILAEYADRCPSGYEDYSGNPHEDAEKTCGDDTDGICPPGCDADQDKDCCFEDDPENFWCDDVPFTGRDDVCTPYVTVSECNACPDGYENEDGERPNCPPRDESIEYEDEPQLKAGADVLLRVDFVDRSYKDVTFVINGMELPVATHSRSITRSIDQFVRYGTNSIVIKPQRDVTIAQMDVRIE
ncbi:MAG: hypothetical protein ACLFTH_01130 [Candidatus Woesearchaeota archaeon]